MSITLAGKKQPLKTIGFEVKWKIFGEVKQQPTWPTPGVLLDYTGPIKMIT